MSGDKHWLWLALLYLRLCFRQKESRQCVRATLVDVLDKWKAVKSVDTARYTIMSPHSHADPSPLYTFSAKFEHFWTKSAQSRTPQFVTPLRTNKCQPPWRCHRLRTVDLSTLRPTSAALPIDVIFWLRLGALWEKWLETKKAMSLVRNSFRSWVTYKILAHPLIQRSQIKVQPLVHNCSTSGILWVQFVVFAVRRHKVGHNDSAEIQEHCLKKNNIPYLLLSLTFPTAPAHGPPTSVSCAADWFV